MSAFLRIWGVVILITSDVDVIIQNLTYIHDIAGIPLTRLISSNYYDVSIHFHASAINYYEGKDGDYHFYIKTHLVPIETNSLRNLIGQFLSLAAISKHFFPIHSSVISTHQGCTVLLGDSGAGKTITSIYACSCYGYKWIANDWSAIRVRGPHHAEVIYGYDNVSLRYEGFLQLLNIFREEDALLFRKQFKDANKIIIDPNIFCAKDTLPRQIQKIAFINVSPNSPRKYFQIDYPTKRLKLLHELSWVLEGEKSNLVLNNGEVVFEKIILLSTPLKDKIETICTYLCNCYNVNYIGGPLEYVVQQIATN